MLYLATDKEPVLLKVPACLIELMTCEESATEVWLPENIPVAGASVWLDSTSLGTATDSTGSFSLVIPGGHIYSTIRVHALGYATQLIPVTSLAKGCPVTLTTALRTEIIGEVVVVGGAFVKRNWWQRLWRGKRH